MVLKVVGSTPISRPINILGCRQAVRHWILIPAPVGSNPATPANVNIFFGPLAQAVEHMTFNHVVRGSSPRWFTKYAPLAQLVEQLTLNQWVLGSSPRRCTKKSSFESEKLLKLLIFLFKFTKL